MGNWIFGKSKKSLHTNKQLVREEDKAILQLKQQRDKVKQYQKKILEQLGIEKNIARQLLKNNQKNKALLLLKKKRFMESILEKTDNQLMTLERLVTDIEFSSVEKTVIEGLKEGNEALKQLHSILSIDQIESILEETKEGIDKQTEIDNLLLGMNVELDEQSLIEELDELLDKTSASVLLPEVPQQPLEAIQQEAKTKTEKQAILAS